MPDRLPAQLEVTALLRRVAAEGGFGAVLRKGAEGGTILILLSDRGANNRVFERMPSLDGPRKWHCAKREETENKTGISDYLDRRATQDHDLWIIELDIADGERFIGLTASGT